MKAFRSALIFAIGALFLSACASSSLPNRSSLITRAAQDGFAQSYAPTATLPLSLLRPGNSQQPALVVIESDGLSFLDAFTPSADPTPRDPMGYHLAAALAAALPHRAVLYVARPCHYLSRSELKNCAPDLWLMGRFGHEAQSLVAHAIQQNLEGAPLVLIGISGGGVIATHLATQLAQTQQLITVAAPLALNDWATHHQVSAYAVQDDPIGVAGTLTHLPQLHIAGARDRIVPPAFVASFAGQNFLEIPGARHTHMWQGAAPLIVQSLRD